MEVLCKSIYRIQVYNTATSQSFSESVKRRTASVVLRNTFMKAIGGEIMLLKRLEGYVRYERLAVEQSIGKVARKSNGDISAYDPKSW